MIDATCRFMLGCLKRVRLMALGSVLPRSAFGIAIIYTGLFVVLIYGPVGWSMMGLIEEWDIFGLFTKFGVFYLADASSPLATHRLRPLTALPFSLGYIFGPYAFEILHLLQATSLVLKGLAVAVIVDWLLANRLIATLSGLIFVTYPADTMQMTFRSLPINLALASCVCGIAMLLDATTRERRFTKLFEGSIAALSFLIASLIYEASLFLAPLPLILWWARLGWSIGLRSVKAQLALVGIWSSAVGLATVFIVAMSLSGSNYQMQVTGGYWTILHDVMTRIPMLFSIALYRLFIHGWYDGFRMLFNRLDFWPWLVLFIFFLTSLFLFLRFRDVEKYDWRKAVRLLAAGMVAAALGYLPYLTSYSHLITSQRTYLYAALGGTLVVAALIYLVAKISPLFAIMLATMCLLSGLGSQWEQIAHYTALSNRQRMILAGILEAAPDAARPASKRLLVIDRLGATSNTWMLRGQELGNALSWFYGAPISPLVCTEPGDQFSSFLSDTSGKSGRCREIPSGWEIGAGLSQPIRLLSADTQMLSINPDGHVVNLNSSTALTIPPSLSLRWKQALGCWPALACKSPPPNGGSASYHYDFGQFWGLDDVPLGGGWRDIEWNLPSLDPTSWAWMTSPEASIWFEIKPRTGPYSLKLRLYYWISERAKHSLTVRLNGHFVEVKPTGENILWADFTSAYLKAGLNEIRLGADQDPQNGLSLAVDWISISPRSLVPGNKLD